jgi:cyclophilin family peptidyl-prolyl cis-trans isomerase
MGNLRRIAVLLVVLGGLAILAGCGDDKKEGDSSTTGGATGATGTTGATGATGTTGATGGRGTAGCKDVAEPRPRRQPRRTRKPSFRLSEDKTYSARVVTSCGTFEIELDPKDAPITGGSFVSLARKGFYDNLTFHRIVTGFVIQGGDPTGTGSGGPGYRVREAPPSDIVYSEGVAAMAKAGNEPPGTSGSQFFVVTSDSSLPPEYALLGRVKKGLNVVHAIEEVPAGPDERPISPVVIEKVDVRTK